MDRIPQIIGNEEKAILALCERYERRGYRKFRMSKFEEYDFYVRNKSFLQSENVLTFSDLSGKLMALKPDITLSIVKNTKDRPSAPEKVYYNENVYRVVPGTNEFRETMQVGLEYIGDVDIYSSAEVMALAAESMRVMGGSYIMDISHMGLLLGLLDAANLSGDLREKISACMGTKNAHELKKLCDENGVDEALEEKLLRLVSIYGPFERAVKEAESLIINEATEAAVRELEEIFKALKLMGCAQGINLDFSLINDMSYYNGVIFKGFVDGVPEAVLSGGRYDKLLKKLGKSAGAIGFAVYLGVIGRYAVSEKEYDVDILLRYTENTQVEDIVKAADELSSDGASVRVQSGEAGDIKYRKMYLLTGKGLETVEGND